MSRRPWFLAHPLRTAWLVVLWLALWGTVTPANLASGLVVALMVQLLPDPYHPEGRVAFRPWPALRFVGYMAVKMVEASLVVAWEVVSRRDRIHTGVVEVPLRGASDQLVTIVANAIGLIPGSITVEVEHDPPTLFVHALHVTSVDEVRDEIHQLEERAIRAFGTPEAIAGLEPDDAQVVAEPAEPPEPRVSSPEEAP